MRRPVVALMVAGLVGAGLVLGLTRPDPLPDDALAGIAGDAARGEQVFWAGGCASCHMAEGAREAEMLRLSGGQRFPSPFGNFTAPNISPDPDHGIGGWAALDLANAMLRGVSPKGAHLYPAFPYPSYQRASLQDVADLHAYLMTLPPDPTPSQPHQLGFPFNIRLTLGGWKLLFLNRDWVVAGDLSPEETRGRYLVEALGHCGECHTPRNALGGSDRSRWLAGAPNPSGRGTIPNITPAGLTWSEAEISTYLATGFTPDYDSAGGHMALVVTNMAHLPESDRAAIAAYLKRVPPVP